MSKCAHRPPCCKGQAQIYVAIVEDLFEAIVALSSNSTMRQIINLAVNQTMSRTVLTTGVTMFVVLAQFLVNWHTDSDLETFAFGMLVGMISGTYSTIFIAAPVLTWISDREAKKPPAPQPPVAAVPAQ